MQLTAGMERLADPSQPVYDPRLSYTLQNQSLPSTPELDIMFGQLNDTYISPELYWENGGDSQTRNTLNAYPAINVSMFAWCRQMNESTEAQVNDYLSTISQLEQDYPNVVFVYMTGNAQATGSYGYNRYLRNEQIRQYCSENDKVLYDFADLDCWYNGELATYTYNDMQIPREHPEYQGDDKNHTTWSSCENKGRALWWLLARIAGWNSGPPPQHGVSIPNTPNGPSSGDLNTNYTFTTGGSTCSQGHGVQYRFDWGDGTYSTWSSSASRSHSWSSTGTYSIRARARCSSDTSILSTWSSGRTMQISSTNAYNLSLSSTTGQPAPGNGGTTNPSPGSYSYTSGSTVDVSAIPNTDFRFSKWTGDVTVPDAYEEDITVAMNQNRTLTAYFFTKCGDVNGDLNITPADAQAAFEIFLKRFPNPSDAQRENSDVNCDGTPTEPNITPADAQAIFEKYLGISELPGDCSGLSRSLTASNLSPDESPFSHISLEINRAVRKTGGLVIVPIILQNTTEMKSFGFDFHFPSDILEFVSIEPMVDTNYFSNIDGNVISDGVLRVGGYTIIPFTNYSPSVLMNLIFKPRKKIDMMDMCFNIENRVDDLDGHHLWDKNHRVKHRK
jgi:hypothetical protein